MPIEDVYVDTADSDTGPHDMGSFASRGTHRVGNAVIVAAQEARGVMLEAAAEELEVNADDLVTDGTGNIHVKGAPRRNRSPSRPLASAAQFKQGKTISGRGIFLIPLSDGRSRDRRDVAGHRLCPCLPGRRSRGRRRDRRRQGHQDDQRL